MNPTTCPLCGATLIPRYEFVDVGVYAEWWDDDKALVIRHICPDCIPPDPPEAPL